jgi:hypothetical protein
MELSLIFYSIAININTSAFWFFPILAVYFIIVILRKAMTGSNDHQNLMNMSTLNNILNRLSTISIVFVVTNLLIWAPILSNSSEQGIFEKAFNKLFYH